MCNCPLVGNACELPLERNSRSATMNVVGLAADLCLQRQGRARPYDRLRERCRSRPGKPLDRVTDRLSTGRPGRSSARQDQAAERFFLARLLVERAPDRRRTIRAYLVLPDPRTRLSTAAVAIGEATAGAASVSVVHLLVGCRRGVALMHRCCGGSAAGLGLELVDDARRAAPWRRSRAAHRGAQVTGGRKFSRMGVVPTDVRGADLARLTRAAARLMGGSREIRLGLHRRRRR